MVGASPSLDGRTAFGVVMESNRPESRGAINSHAIGIDIGGTGLKVGRVALGADPAIVASRVLEGHATEDPERAMDRLVAAVRELTSGEPPAAVGVGCAGLVDGAAGIVHASPNLPAWRSVALGSGLKQRLGQRVWLLNDAQAFLLAEWRLGAAAGARHAIFLTLGSGVGGGLVFDGAPYRGASGLGAEIGHMSVDFDGPVCPCGNRGCLELYVGRHAIEREARARGLASEGCVDPVEVAAWARRGEPRAVALLAEMGTRLGAALAGLVNLCDPEVIVVGGGVAEVGALLLEPARAELEARSMVARQRNVPLRPARFGPLAGLIGAALFAAEAESAS